VAAIRAVGVRGAVRRKLGIPFRHLRGQPRTPELIAAAVEPPLDERKAWPSRLQFERAGLSGLWFAIHHGEGHTAMAACYGLALRRPDLQRQREVSEGNRETSE
jgi:hypothetical protein